MRLWKFQSTAFPDPCTILRLVGESVIFAAHTCCGGDTQHALDRDGMLYASSFITSEVYGALLDESTHHWRWFRVVSKGGGGVGLDGPTGLAVDDDLRLYVASFATDQIFR